MPHTIPADFPHVMPMRQRAEVIVQLLRQRLDQIMLLAIRASGIDFWLILCQENESRPGFYHADSHG